MILKSIKLKNFLSHEDTLLTFTPQQHLLIDGVSGSGKSSIVDALVWNLYGRGRVDNRSLIKTGAKYAEVTLVLSSGGKDTRIRRKVDSEGKQTILVATDDLHGKTKPVQITGLKATQEYIEKEIVGSSYELFINSVIYPQENPDSFVRQTATKRKEIILEIAKASYFDDYLERAKEKITELELEKATLAAEMTHLSDDLLRDEKVIEYGETAKTVQRDLEREVADLEMREELHNAKQLALSGLVAERKELQVRADLIQLEYKVNTEKEKELQDKLDSWVPSDTSKFEGLIKRFPEIKEEFKRLKEYEDAREAFMTARMEVMASQPVSHDYEKDIDELNAQIIKEMSQTFVICPGRKEPCPVITSGRDSRVASLTERLEIKKEEKEKYIERLTDYQKRMDACGSLLRWGGRNKMDIENDMSDAASAEIRLNNLKATDATTLATMKSSLESLSTTLARVIEESTKVTDRIKELDKLVAPIEEYLKNTPFDKTALRATIKLLESTNAQIALALEARKRYNITKYSATLAQKKWEQLEEKLSSLALLKTALGPNGVKAVVIDYIIPRLEERINVILEKLSDFRVRLDTQKSNVTGEKMLEGLFISISNGQGAEIDFDGYSGGEKLKITVAIAEALSEIQNAKFRILDEVFVGLDEESTEKFGDIMLALQERFSQLICISHLRSIKSLFNDKITVSKINGASKIC